MSGPEVAAMHAHEPNPYTPPAGALPAQSRRRLPIPVRMLAYVSALVGLAFLAAAVLSFAAAVSWGGLRPEPMLAPLLFASGGLFLASARSQFRDRPDFGFVFAAAAIAIPLGFFVDMIGSTNVK